MAVKKVGDDPKAARRVTCRRCGSILEYLILDIQETSSRDYDGGLDTHQFIQCPQCQIHVKV